MPMDNYERISQDSSDSYNISYLNPRESETDNTTFSLPNLSTFLGLGRVFLTCITSPSQEQANQNRENKEKVKENIQKSFSFRSYIPDFSALWKQVKAYFPSFSFFKSTKHTDIDPYEGRESFSSIEDLSQNSLARNSLSDDPTFLDFFKTLNGNEYPKSNPSNPDISR